MHHSGSTERRAERVELPLFHIAQLEPVGLREAQCVPCPRPVSIEPGAPDDYVVGLGRGILVKLGKPLRGDDAGNPRLRPWLIGLMTASVDSASPEPLSEQ